MLRKTSADDEHTPDAAVSEPGFFNKLIRLKKLESVFLFVTSRSPRRSSLPGPWPPCSRI